MNLSHQILKKYVDIVGCCFANCGKHQVCLALNSDCDGFCVIHFINYHSIYVPFVVQSVTHQQLLYEWLYNLMPIIWDWAF